MLNMTLKTYSFQEQLELSKKYEQMMLTYWRMMLGTHCVSDMRESQKYRDMDIDFIKLSFEDDILKARTIELKVDFRMFDTGNLFIEETGWLFKTRAEIIAYLDVVDKVCYYISTKKLRNYLKDNSSGLKKVLVKTGDFGGYEVTGTLLPLGDMIVMCNPYIEDLKNILT